nr:uncharacterized protein LOC117280567 [Nicotiana tomentosiformis]
MTRPLVKKTPYELLKGRKPNISHLMAFGCKCFVHNNGKDSQENLENQFVLVGSMAGIEKGILVIEDIGEISDNDETVNESMGIESQDIGDSSGDKRAADGLVRLRKQFHEPVHSLAKIDKSLDLVQNVSDSYNQKKKSKVGKTAGKSMGGTKRKSAPSIPVATPPTRGITTRIQKK